MDNIREYGKKLASEEGRDLYRLEEDFHSLRGLVSKLTPQEELRTVRDALLQPTAERLQFFRTLLTNKGPTGIALR